MFIRELYRFTIGASIWTYSKGSGIYTHNSETYNPTPIKRGKIFNGKNTNKQNLKVDIDLDSDFGQTMLGLAAISQVLLTIFAWNGSTYEMIFKGRVVSKDSNEKWMLLNTQPFTTYIRQQGNRPKYGKNCKAILYGRGCWLDHEDFEENLTATAYVGNVFTVTGADGFADGYFRGGMVKDADDSFWYIRNHVGTSITLQRDAKGLKEDIDSSPTAVDLYPGCDHTRPTCRNTFSNEINYFGDPYLYKNPMDGRNIFGG